MPDLSDRDDQYLGMTFMVGVLTVAFIAIGGYQLLSGGGWLLDLTGAGFPFFAASLLALSYAAIHRSTRGGALYYAVGFGLIGAGLVSRGSDLSLAIIGAGAALAARGLIVRLRDMNDDPLTDEEHIGFLLGVCWLFVALLSGDPLAALRLAAVGLVAWHLVPTMARGYQRFAAWVKELFTVAEPEPEIETYDLGIEEFHEEKEKIRAFIAANYKDWLQPTFQESVSDSPSYITHILDKPYNVKGDVFAKREDDMTAALNLRNKSLIISLDGSRNAFLIQIVKPREKTTPLHFETIYAPPDPEAPLKERRIFSRIRSELRKPYSFVVGLDPFGDPLFGNIEDNISPHTLVAGGTGSGKSIFMHAVLVQLLTRENPKNLQILFADAGLTTQEPYAKVPHLWRPLTTDKAQMIENIKDLVEERERRLGLFASAGVVDRRSYMSKFPKDELPLILLIADEAATFTNIKELKEPYTTRVLELLNNGRKVGIHVMLGLQRPMADTLGTGFKDQLRRRVIFQLESEDHSVNVLGDGNTSAAKLRGHGDGLYKVGPDIIRFQGYFIPDKDWAQPGRKWLGNYIDEIQEAWGTNDFSRAATAAPGAGFTPAASPMMAQSSADAQLAAEHLRTVDNAGWLVLRGLELAFVNVPDAWENPRDFVVTSDSLLLFVKRALPEGYRPTVSLNASMISETLTRLTGERPARGGVWPFTRSTASALVARYRQINEREWYIMRGAGAFMTITERPEKISPTAIINATTKLLSAPLDPALTAKEVDDTCRRLIGTHWMDDPRGQGEWATASAIVKTLIANYGVVTPKAEVVAEPPRPRPSVSDVANRPPKDPF